jgi:hypothetical protein
MVNRVLQPLLWVLTTVPLAAHHSFLAEYDANKLITKKADGGS